MSKPEQPPEEILAEEILKEIAEVARLAIAQALEGNGADPQSLRFERASGGIYAFPSGIIVNFRPQATEIAVEGKNIHGREVANRLELAKTIQEFEKSAAENPVVLKAIDAYLSQQHAGGFDMEKGHGITLHETKAEITLPEKCQECSGTGQRNCADCNALGVVACPACQGQGRMVCPGCRGTRTITTAEGPQPCQQCHENGFLICARCNAKTSVMCPRCSGARTENCPPCAATGWISNVITVIFDALFTFEADLKKLPDFIRDVLRKEPLKKLFERKDADISKANPVPESFPLRMEYQTRFPAARVCFMLEREEINAVILGQQGRIVSSDPFLDKLIKPGIVALQKISEGPLATQALIEKACKYELLREVLGFLAHMSRRQAYHRIFKKHPFGISEKYAKAAVQYADKALKKISVKPRIIGAGLGILAAGTAFGLYFSQGARALFLNRLPPEFSVTVDMTAILAGLYFSLYTVKIMTIRSLRRILPADVMAQSRGLPSAGKYGFWAVFGAAVSLVLILNAMATPPFWYTEALRILKTILHPR